MTAATTALRLWQLLLGHQEGPVGRQIQTHLLEPRRTLQESHPSNITPKPLILPPIHFLTGAAYPTTAQ